MLLVRAVLNRLIITASISGRCGYQLDQAAMDPAATSGHVSLLLQPASLSILRPDARSSRQRRAIFASVTAFALCCAVIWNSSFNFGEKRELLWDSSSSATGIAAAVRGSVPTADVEASAIMQTNGFYFDQDMGVPYMHGVERSGLVDPTLV